MAYGMLIGSDGLLLIMLNVVLALIEESGVFRDVLYVLISLSILSLLYLSMLMFRRVKDAGIISSTFGFGLYLLGESVFHFGSLVLVFYDAFDGYGPGFWATNMTYLVSMALFSILTELEIQKYKEQFPKENTIYERVPYLNSLISIFVLAIVLTLSLQNRALVSLGFLMIVFPFISSSSRSMKRLEGLKMLEDSNPQKWFFIGLSLSGFSNFLTGLPMNIILAIVIQAICIISGALMMVYAWKMIPSFDELEWYSNLERLMVFQRKGSLVLYSHEFQVEEQDTTSSKNVLASGAISGIQSLLSEITSSKELINIIDHGDKTLYFEHKQEVSFVLFCEDKSREYNTRLSLFATDFMNEYGEKVKNWKGNLNDFEDAKNLVKKNFFA